MRVATDVGGTFTDLVYVSEGDIRSEKVSTTPPDFELGVIAAIRAGRLRTRDIAFFAHGSTTVINALTERKGAKTGLITTRGFRDVVEIARGNTPDLFNIYYSKPRPFVRRHLRRELTERVDYQGNVVTPLDLTDLPEIIRDFKAHDVEAVAVCFLHSYVNAAHEAAAVAAIREQWPEVAVIASSDISREWREFERTTTTVLSAYVLPVAQRYLRRLGKALADAGVRTAPLIMQSNGGIATCAAASANPIALVESGPVSGILGAVAFGRLIGETSIIALDIGGTTAKCSLIDRGETRVTTEYALERSATSPGYPVQTPVIDIVEIGNGGGSIAWVDHAGSMHVGPQSAGSAPGPVAYGRGGDHPTTTDANLLSGRINPQRFLGGASPPDLAQIEAAFRGLGGQLGMAGRDVANGVIRIANANMVNALKLVSLNRGYDPRDFSLMAFGGGGALHAAALAQELGVPKVIVPPHAAVFSAWGMLMLDLRRDYVQTRVTSVDAASAAAVRCVFTSLERRAASDFLHDGFQSDRLMFERFLHARYRGQEHTVRIRSVPEQDDQSEWLERVLRCFHEAHAREYSFRLAASVEIVNFHLVAYALVEKPDLRPLAARKVGVTAVHRAERLVDFDSAGMLRTAIFERERLCCGDVLRGPAIVEEESTATVVWPGQRLHVDAYGGLHIHIRGETSG